MGSVLGSWKNVVTASLSALRATMQYRMYEVWVGAEHGNEVVEGGGEVGLECWTLSGEKMGHITWYKTTAWQAAGTRLLCPVSPQPAGSVPPAQHLGFHSGCSNCSNAEENDEAFDVLHDVVISSIKAIAMVEWKTFFGANKKRFLRKCLKILILAGVHGDMEGNVWTNEGNKFVKTSKKLVEKLKNELKEDFQMHKLEMEVLDVGSLRKGSEIDLEELAEAVKNVKWDSGKVEHPDLIIEAFCWSRNSVLNDVFFRSGIFPSMILNQDRAEVTAFRCLKADEKQKQIIDKISIENPKNVIFAGPVGSGKTLLAAMVLMMKYHKLVEQFGREAVKENVLVIYSVYETHGTFSNLLEELKKKILPFSRHYDNDQKKFINTKNVVGVTVQEILGPNQFSDNPKADMEEIIMRLSSKEGFTTRYGILINTRKFKKILLMIDEVFLDGFTFNGDWSDFIVDNDRVDLIMAFRVGMTQNSSTLFYLPSDIEDKLFVSKLAMQYRYCPEIRKFLHEFTNLDEFPFNDITDVPIDPQSLPRGDVPVWIQRTVAISDVQILEVIQKRFMVSEENPSVTVIYDDEAGERCDTADWCEMHGWRYVSDADMCGTDDQAIVAIDCCGHQAWSRAREKLYIVTTKGSSEFRNVLGWGESTAFEWLENIDSKLLHDIIKKHPRILDVITYKDLKNMLQNTPSLPFLVVSSIYISKMITKVIIQSAC